MTAEPLAVAAVRCVLDTRLPATRTERDAVESKANALCGRGGDSAPLYVRVTLGHADCQARCGRSAPIEMWSVRTVEEAGGVAAGGQPTLPPIFLLNAIRSHVHFSQMSSWLAKCTEEEKRRMIARYEVVDSDELTAPPDATLVEHAFPHAADATRALRVCVSVRFVQREERIAPSGVCLQMGPLPTDEWLIPSPLPSPGATDYEGGGALAMVEAALFGIGPGGGVGDTVAAIGGKHKASDSPPYTPDGPQIKTAFIEDGLIVPPPPPQRTRDRSRRPHDASPARRVDASPHAKRSGARRALFATAVQAPRGRAIGARRLIGSWEESLLRGGVEGRKVHGYELSIAASGCGQMCAPTTLPLDTVAAAHASLTCVARATIRDASGAQARRGYAVPERGQLQITLINGERTAVRMCLIPYDLSHMPPSACMLLRHRESFVPAGAVPRGERGATKFVVQLTVHSSRAGRVYVSGEVVVLFSTDASTDGCNVEAPSGGVAVPCARFELRGTTECSEWSEKPAPARSSRSSRPTALHSSV